MFLSPLSLLHNWMNYSLNKFSNCMGFPRTLLLIEITDFWVHFGKNSSKWWGQIWLLAQSIIHKLMAKQIGWINGWRDTWGTMLVGNKRHGSNGCIWVSFSIILLFVCPLECLLSKKFMFMMHSLLLTEFFCDSIDPKSKD